MENITALDLFAHLNLDDVAEAFTALTRFYKPDREPLTGGVLSILVASTRGSTFESSNVGEPGGKVADYAFFANEKIRRVYNRRLTPEGQHEYAASQSANETEEKYGGCIVGTCPGSVAYISFSAAPAKVDEAGVYVLNERLGFFVPQDYDNDLVPKARELFDRTTDV